MEKLKSAQIIMFVRSFATKELKIKRKFKTHFLLEMSREKIELNMLKLISSLVKRECFQTVTETHSIKFVLKFELKKYPDSTANAESSQ